MRGGSRRNMELFLVINDNVRKTVIFVVARNVDDFVLDFDFGVVVVVEQDWIERDVFDVLELETDDRDAVV